MATISLVLRRDAINKKGEAPINFFIIKHRKLSKIKTGIKIAPQYWDAKKSRIKPNATNSARLNSFLQNKLSELQDQVFEHETITKSLTNKQLKEKIYGKKPIDFFAFANEVCEEYLKANKIGTYDKNKSIIQKLKDYQQSNTLDFQDITPVYLSKYDKYLRNTLGNKTNTIHKDMKFIRKIFNDAYKMDLIEHSHNPFKKYELKTEKTQRNFLTEEELKSLEHMPTEKETKLELHKDMFIFAAYAGGLRVSDTLLLKWQYFDGLHINFTIQKTGNQLSIKLPNTAINIINKYKLKQPNKQAFIFPMLPNELDLKNPREVDSEISSATAYINKNLKILAQKAGIEKPLSFHISRHTWATRALRKGISIDKVSKLMGHAQLRETQIYAKIVNEELDKAMDAFND